MDIITTARRYELTPDVREHAEKSAAEARPLP